MKSSKWLVGIVLGCMTLGLYGCGDGLSDREKSCLEATGNLQCKSKEELELDAQTKQAAAELELAKLQANADIQMAEAQSDIPAAQPQNIDYGPVQPGNYTNYYGNPQYGQWLPNGQFQFHDPYGHAASSTNAFLLGAGLGGLTGYLATKAAMRSNWNHSNPHGWNSHSWKTNNYTYNGKVMSKDEALRRMAQSNRDRAKQQAQLKKQLKIQTARLQKQKYQNNTTNKYTKTYTKVQKKPNYMTQARAPGNGLNLSKVTKTLKLSKPKYSPSRSTSTKYRSNKRR